MNIEEIRKQKKKYLPRCYGILIFCILIAVPSFFLLLFSLTLTISESTFRYSLCLLILFVFGVCVFVLSAFKLSGISYFTYWRKLEILYSYLNGEPYRDKGSILPWFRSTMYLKIRNCDIHYGTVELTVSNIYLKKQVLDTIIQDEKMFLLEPYRLRVTIFFINGHQDEFEVVVDPEALTYQLAKDLLTAKQLKALDLTEKEGKIFSVS